MIGRIFRKRALLLAATGLVLSAGTASAGLTVSSELNTSDPTWDRYRFWLSGFTGTDLTYTYTPPDGVSLPQHAQNNQVSGIQGTFTVSPGGQISVPGDLNYDDGGPQTVQWEDLTNASFTPPPAAPPVPTPRSTGQFSGIASLNFARSPDNGTPGTMTGTWFGLPGGSNSNFKTPGGSYTNGPVPLGNGLQSSGSALFEIYVTKGSVVRFNGLYNSYAVSSAATSFSVPNTWDGEGGDTNWNTSTNWGDNVTPASGNNVSFMLAGAQATVDAPVTAGTITLNRGDVFTIGGGSTLTLNSGITAMNGNAYVISAPVALGGANAWNVATGSVVSLTGGVSGSSTITKTGAGIADLGGANASLTGALQISQGTFRVSGTAANLGDVDGAGTLSLLTGAATTANHYRTGVLDLQGTALATVKSNGGTAGASKVTTLTMSASAKLNLKDNDLVVDSGTVADIKAKLTSGRNGGTWDGAGISSDLLALPANVDKALGYAAGNDPNIAGLGGSLSGQAFTTSSAVLVKYTYAADANLDGKVDVVDLGTLATNWQGTNREWTQANFNYYSDNIVDVVDLGILATNWQKGIPTPLGLSFADALHSIPAFENFTVVPEPATGGLLMLAAGLLVRRRRVQ